MQAILPPALRFPSTSNPYLPSFNFSSLQALTFSLQRSKSPNPLPSPSNFSSGIIRRRPLYVCITAHSDSNGEEGPRSRETRIRAPTAPWMNGPLLVPGREVLDLSSSFSRVKWKKTGRDKQSSDRDRFLTEKLSGRMGKKAAKKIVQSIENLRSASDSERGERELGKIGDGIFSADLDGNGDAMLERRRRLPWVSEEREALFRRTKREKVPMAAQLSLEKELLWRLRREAKEIRNWVKVNKAGVTEAVVDEVRSVWSNSELVMLRIGLPLCRNMDRAREIVELKTGGLVVWSKKDKLVAYRGCDYQRKGIQKIPAGKKSFGSPTNGQELKNSAAYSQADVGVQMGGEEECELMPYQMFMGGEAGKAPVDKSLYEREGDRMLEGLGPRFVDWWYPKPLPVDADLLPEFVPGFKSPFRLAPPKVRPKLMDGELTDLRKSAIHLPTHFVLGRNSRLQGLAAAILKLWERCIIAKIAVKWGVQNTNNELMASELKRLTGGVLLLRNKYFIILYRGKDFLPGDVASLVAEREMELRQWQLYEEDMRNEASRVLHLNEEASVGTSAVGTLSEFHGIREGCVGSREGQDEADIQLLAEKDKLERELRKQEFKLAILRRKIRRSLKELSKLNATWMLSEEEPDQELMTVEERECFKKIGLKMTHILVLGRRGVFDGVIEGMYQHWKHRELVKVISKQRTYSQVIFTARTLERESGGVLVSVDKHKLGYSIIIYRGKNYKRPISVGNNLLNKRKALQRSLEMQRHGSLNFFAYQREKEISDLKQRLDALQSRKAES